MYLHHVQLAIPRGSEDIARAFWIDLLGFDEIPKPAALQDRGGLWIKRDEAEIHLGIEEPFRPAGKAHPALVVADLDALIEKLNGAGYESRPDSDIYDFRRIHTDDPFGNRIEILSRRQPRT